MVCQACKREFEGRADARFCSPKCRKQASRLVTDNTNVTDNVTDNPRMFTPNWKHHGFKSADEAMKYAIALTLKRVPAAVISWRGRTWTSDDITPGKGIEPII